MIKNTLLFILSIFSYCFYAQNQIYDQYPSGQYFYKGGVVEFYKEVKKIINEQNLLPCKNSQEKYILPLVVNSNGTINFIKADDSVDIAANKCAYEFGRKLVPDLKNWSPAKINNKDVSAIVELPIDPFYLYYTNPDPSSNKIVEPKFQKGIESFSYQIKDIFEKRIGRNENKTTRLIFDVNENGEMENIVIVGVYYNLDRIEIIRDLKRIKGTWNAGTFNGIPRKFRVGQTIRQEFSVDYEREMYERSDAWRLGNK